MGDGANTLVSRKTNRIKKKSLVATILAIVTLFVAGLATSSPVKADGLPVIEVSGTLYENQTWTNGSVYFVNGSVTIASNVTLTIEPGVIVKYATGWGSTGINVASGGTLSATGTSTSPITFTSIKDDSVGGDSNGDGASSGVTGDY